MCYVVNTSLMLTDYIEYLENLCGTEYVNSKEFVLQSSP
jgi:hypothetical protein